MQDARMDYWAKLALVLFVALLAAVGISAAVWSQGSQVANNPVNVAPVPVQTEEEIPTKSFADMSMTCGEILVENQQILDSITPYSSDEMLDAAIKRQGELMGLAETCEYR